MKALGPAAGMVVLGGVLTAWMEPPSAGLMHAGALMLAAGCVLYALMARVELPVHWAVLVPLACAALGIAQAFLRWTVYPFETWNSVTAWLARAAVFSAAYAGFQRPENRDRLKSVIVWFGGAFSLLALLQWYTSAGKVFWSFETAYRAEAAGTFANRDQYAAFIELLLPIALAASIRQRRWLLVPAACAGLMFASVVASASRAGTIIVCTEALVFLVAAVVGHRRNYRAAGLIAASLALCTLVGGWTCVWERFSADDPFAYRREMLTASLDMIRSRPLTGFGLGTWPAVYPAFAVFDPPGIYMNHAHNDWAEWTAEGGLPLLAILAVFACVAALQLRRDLWALGIPAVLVHALVDFPLQKPALACAVFFLAGVSLSGAVRISASAGCRSCESPRP